MTRSNGELIGSTTLVGIMGWPVSHSQSPRMHNAAFGALELDWAYLPLPVSPARLGDAVRGLAALGFAGANVTIPHKQEVVPFLDELTPAAAAIGAVNTIVVRLDGSLLGDNTDAFGFIADLRAHGVTPRSCLVLGSGGAARAVAYALAAEGLPVAVAARSIESATILCKDIRDATSAELVAAHRFPHDLRVLGEDADLIVNATSLGLHEEDAMPWGESPFRPGQVVYDLVYNRPTPLLASAQRQGATAINGLGMLVHQGALAFELWTGRPAPLDVMRAALVTG